MRERYCATIIVLVFAFGVTAQQARLDSLLRVLKAQPGKNEVRMNTLTQVGTTYRTIRPSLGIEAAREALRIAETLNSDLGRAGAWTSEYWNLYFLAENTKADSVMVLARAAARRSKDMHALAIALALPPAGQDMSNAQVLKSIRERLDSACMLLKQQGDSAGLAEVLYTYSREHELNNSADLSNRAFAMNERLGNKSGMGASLCSRIAYEPYLSDPQGNIKDLSRALDLFEADGNICYAMGTHGNIGWMYAETADYERAIHHQLMALKMAELFGDPTALSATHDNCGDIYVAMGDLHSAAEQYRAGSASGPPEMTLININGLGSTFLLMHQPDSTLLYLDRALRKNSLTEKAVTKAETKGILGEAYAMKGDVLKAVDLYNAALEVARTNTYYYPQVIRFAFGLGRLYRTASDAELSALGVGRATARAKAAVLLQESLDLARKQGMLKEQGNALLELSLLSEDEGELAQALRLHQQYAAMKDSTLNADKAKAVSNLKIQYETEKKEQEIVPLGKDKEVQAKEIQKQKLVRNGFIGGFALVLAFAGVFLFQRNRISKEKHRSEELLLNILPAEIARELKAKGEAEAVHIDQVTVLFTDFKGFTAMSEVLSPKALVKDLHECFSAFDLICEKYGIEKIKTIGDAYMAAGGLPTPNTTHAQDSIKAAFAMRDFIAEGKARKVAAGLPYFEIRIGIHTGPVVAGIVGVKKFSYDIWGDTVNTASRMESSGEVGQVNISEATYALVKDAISGEDGAASTHRVDRDKDGGALTGQTQPAFTFTPRGKVQAKGKGEMEMYFV